MFVWFGAEKQFIKMPKRVRYVPHLNRLFKFGRMSTTLKMCLCRWICCRCVHELHAEQCAQNVPVVHAMYLNAHLRSSDFVATMVGFIRS